MTDYRQWLRARIGHELIPLAYATAVVRDSADGILFQRRSDFDWWGLPGGIIEPGEAPADCARREVREETGLTVENMRFTGIYSSPRYNVLYPNGDRVQQVTWCYECRVLSGELRPDGVEAIEAGFFPAVDLPQRPIWYADMVGNVLGGEASPYFDPPSTVSLATRFPTILSLRTVVGRAPAVWPGMSAAVFDDEGRLLLHQRGDSGLWALPAGALDAGETLAHTAVREVAEETGLIIEPIRLVGAYGGYEVTYPNGDRLYPVGGLFLCRVAGGVLQADGAESLDVRFVSPADLPDLAPRTLPRMIPRIQTALAAYRHF